MPFVHLSHLLTNGHVCALLLASEEVDSWVKNKKRREKVKVCYMGKVFRVLLYEMRREGLQKIQDTSLELFKLNLSF